MKISKREDGAVKIETAGRRILLPPLSAFVLVPVIGIAAALVLIWIVQALYHYLLK